MTGLASGSTFSMIGSSISTGSRPLMIEIFSLTSWTARSISLSSTNSTRTLEMPSVLVEITDLTPFIVFTVSSILSVTSMSIISGLAPLRVVVILTMGKSTFGNRSTPMRG